MIQNSELSILNFGIQIELNERMQNVLRAPLKALVDGLAKEQDGCLTGWNVTNSNNRLIASCNGLEWQMDLNSLRVLKGSLGGLVSFCWKAFARNWPGCIKIGYFQAGICCFDFFCFFLIA